MKSPVLSGSAASLAHRKSREPMHLLRHYAVFGGVLCSELEFPELEITHDVERTSWTLHVERCAPPNLELTPLGERQLGRETYRLWRTPMGLRLEYSHAGVYDISADGSRMSWYERADALPELVRNIVLGPALALALELAGFLCLHGSAVVLENQGLVFLGPKHHGKSTIASALTVAGARLVGDDLVAVAPGPPAMVRPGVPSVRLWGDTANALPMQGICESLIPGVKTTATGFAGRAHTRGQVPLAAIYVLEPAHKTSEASCRRTGLPPVSAAIAVAHQTKLADSLIGMRAAGAQLSAAVKVAATVPVFTLSVARDLARLPELVQQIFAWHDVRRTSPNMTSASGPGAEPTHEASRPSYSGEVCF